MLKLYLIRHGQTPGNALGRYLGTTDEGVTEEAVKLLNQCCYPRVQRVYSSPLKRCRQTADLIYPGMNPQQIPELKECDFGIFENKNYQELAGCLEYQRWIDSNGILPFPGGESQEHFRSRSVQGFGKVIYDCLKEGWQRVAIVAHGGTIMAIMQAHGTGEPFYSWQVKNGGGYEVTVDEQGWQKNGKFTEVQPLKVEPAQERND